MSTGNDLRFWKTPPDNTGGGDLRFGETSSPVTPDVTGDIAETLQGLSGGVSASVKQPITGAVAGALADLTGTVEGQSIGTVTGAIAATLEGVSGTVEAVYDNNVWRWTGQRNADQHQVAEPARVDTVNGHSDAAKLKPEAAQHHQVAEPLEYRPGLVHQQSSPVPHEAQNHHQVSEPIRYDLSQHHEELTRAPRPTLGMRHKPAQPAGTVSVSNLWEQLDPGVRPTVIQHWQPGRPLGFSLVTDHQVGETILKWMESWFQVAAPTIWGWGGPLAPYIPPWPSDRCWGPHIGGAKIIFRDWLPTRQNGRLVFDCPPKDLEIPDREIYIMQTHSIYVKRVSDDEPIATQANLEIALEADSWAWTLRANLIGEDALALIEPVGGEPVVIEVGINGNVWHFIVEDWTHDIQFGGRSIAITGRSLSALLAAPYEQPKTYTETSLRTVQQLADQELPFEWSMTWEPPAYLVTAGAWTYTNLTPMEAISLLAQGPGGIVVPAMAAKELAVRLRYPLAPWEFSGATPALTIPESAITQYSKRYAPEDQANAVYVHGAETGGVQGRVYRLGTAGDQLAETVMDPLITHADAARSRGKRILAGQAQAPAVRSVTLPLDDGTLFPLAAVGDLVEVDLAAGAVRGIVAGVNITVNRSTGVQVRQTLTLGEDTPNVWAQFKKLVPSAPLLVGRVTTNHGNNTLTVELTAGGLVRVRGEAAVNERIYIQNGAMVDKALALTHYDLTV